MERGELRFGVDARHIRQLGRELVADRLTAISELIKNAYDADATEVTLSFHDAAGAGGTFTVTDNGTGMSLGDVERGWMRISTDVKEASPLSEKYSRPRAGRKGIGRFAAETLGRRLVLSSLGATARERVVLTFDWESKYRAGVDLHDVANEYSLEAVPPDTPSGTALTIEDLYDAWGENDLKPLADHILLLQPPFPIETRSKEETAADPGFHVRVLLDDRELRSPATLAGFTDAATAEISGNVDNTGRGVWTVKSDRLSFADKVPVEERFSLTGPFVFRAFYFVFARDALGDLATSTARRMGNEYGGIRLYRDGLRILPYGDPRDDWLDLDLQYRRRSTRTLFPLGTINFFGQVAITRADNDLLVDTASREGLVENPAFGQLSRFVRRGLIWGAGRIAAARASETPKPRGDRMPRRYLLTTARTQADEAIELLRRGEGDRAQEVLATALKQTLVEAEQAEREEGQRQADLVEELDLLRILASLGTAIAVFGHEIRANLNIARGALSDVEASVQHRDRPSSADALHMAADAIDHLDEIGDYIDVYVSRARRREREAQPVHEVIRQFLEAFDHLLNRREIAIAFDVSPLGLRTRPMARSQFEAILFNFLSNSIKALDREGLENRKIRVDGLLVDGDAVVRFQDSGVGIEPGMAERIFDAFFTTSQSGDETLGVGTGLGLKIVRDIALAQGGSVAVAEADVGFETCLELRLPAVPME